MSRHACLLTFALLFGILACDDVRGPVGPATPEPTADISDGRVEGGNEDFFFLPPVMPDPRTLNQYDAGAFNPNLRPSVQVCLLAGDPAAPGGTQCESGADGQPVIVASFPSGAVRVSSLDEHYAVNWDTDRSALSTTRFYRLQVFVGAKRLGFIDIDPVTSSRDLRNRFTGEGIQLVDGRTLPVKFRIENGALCDDDTDCAEFTVTNDGGTFVTATKDAGVQFRAGVLPAGVEEITLTIERVHVGENNRCHGEASAYLWKEYEGCYAITSDPDLRPYGGLQAPEPNADGSVSAPAIVGQCVEVSLSDPLYTYLQPYKSHNGGELQRLSSAPAPFLDCAGFEGSQNLAGLAANPLIRLASAGVRRLTTGFGAVFAVRTLHAIDLGLGEELPIGSSFSRFNWAIGLEAEIVGGNSQEVGFGMQAGEPLVVQIRSLHSHPGTDGNDVDDHHPENVAGVTVRFTVTEGDGYFEVTEAGVPVRMKDVPTDANGRASVPFIAASNSASNRVTAASPTLDPAQAVIAFAVAGLPPDLVVENITPSLAQPAVGDALTWSIVVKNVGGGVALPSTAEFFVVHEEDSETDATRHSLAVARLAPGAADTIASPVIPPPHEVGDHNAVVRLNASGAVVEADYENNQTTAGFIVRSGAGAVAGTVSDAASNAPLPGATVSVVGTTLATLTNASGEYRIANIPQGTVTLQAQLPGYDPASVNVFVSAGADTLANFQLVRIPPPPTLALGQAPREHVSMMTGSSLQLEYPSESPVTWMAGDATRATVSTNGLMTIVRGNEDPAVENESWIYAATTGGPYPEVQVIANSWDFAGDRPTTVVWNRVPGASAYRMWFSWSSCEGAPSTCTNWSTPSVTVTAALSHKLEFSGFAKGRWRVEALDASGALLATSPYVYVGFLGS